MEKRMPVVVIRQIGETDAILRALQEYGIRCAEITFRTPCAEEALIYACKNYPQMLVGAGTVINAGQCREALDAGAQFIVGPGFSQAVAAVCREAGVLYLPGCATPTEIMAALDEGIDIVKFFPAGVYGGPKAIKSIGAAFPGVRFVPTGGVDAGNLADYLALGNVFAVGGSWMLKGTRAEMTDKVRAAVALLG